MRAAHRGAGEWSVVEQKGHYIVQRPSGQTLMTRDNYRTRIFFTRAGADRIVDAANGGKDFAQSVEISATPYRTAYREWLRKYLTELLAATKGNKTHAARLAKYNRQHFYELLRRAGLRVGARTPEGSAAWQGLSDHRMRV